MTRWAGRDVDWIQRMIRHPPRKEEVIIAHENAEAADDTPREKAWVYPSKEPRDLDPMVLEPPVTTEGTELVIRGDSTTVVD